MIAVASATGLVPETAEELASAIDRAEVVGGLAEAAIELAIEVSQAVREIAAPLAALEALVARAHERVVVAVLRVWGEVAAAAEALVVVVAAVVAAAVVVVVEAAVVAGGKEL